MNRDPRGELRRTLGFRDLLLFYIATTFGLRWMATAAASGPSALVIWCIGGLGLFIPLLFATIELSSRFPGEGGIYLWSREAFGPFAGFLSAWSYWCANLPYFPSLLYFTAANLLLVGGDRWMSLSTSATYFIIVSGVGLAFALALNIRGLELAKWLNNLGAIASWVVAAALIGLGTIVWIRFGSATPMPAASFVPAASFKDVIFWSTIAFAFGGIESASSMGDEIVDARRTVPRAVVASAAIMILLYLAGTLSILVAVPRERISGLDGITQAIQAVTERLHAGWLVPLLALALAVSSIGGVGAWFAAVARLPFVAGVDRYLPAAFGTLHPRWKTPYVALTTQAAVAALFILFGQAGTTVRGAYDVLVSMAIVTYFIPFLFMFAALIRVQRYPCAPEVRRVPGGAAVARALGAVGFLVTAASIVFATVPASGDPHPVLTAAKVIGLSMIMCGAGVAVYVARPWRGRQMTN